MKKWTACLAALILLAMCGTALAAGAITLEQAPFTGVGTAVTPDGNTVIATGLRDKGNQTNGKNPTAAWLACIGEDGRILWEKRDEKPDGQCIYNSPCVFKDGSVIALYIERSARDDGTKAKYMLRSFSPQGESTGELALDDTYSECLPTDNGMLVSHVDISKPRPFPRHCTLYGASLKPVWTLDGVSANFRYDTAVSDGDGMTLLYRNSSISSQIDQVRLIRVDGQGKALWTRTLAEKQMGYMALQIDPSGNRIVFLNGWLQDGFGQTANGKLICFDPEGNELWSKPVKLPEEDGMFELSDFRLLTDGYLLMGLAKTETRVRLYRLNQDGKLVGITDHYAHEETAHTPPRFAELGGILYASVEEKEDGRSTAILIPLTVPEK
jgi:hypothetical protein